MTVLDSNRSDDTFGWGVVLSDDAMARMKKNNPQPCDAIRGSFAYWDDIAVVHKGKQGKRMVWGGHGIAGIWRMKILLILQGSASEQGVDLQFQTEFKTAEEYRRDYDLMVATDGINSLVRREYAFVFKPDIDQRLVKFIWLGKHQKFDDAFTFIFEQTEWGWFWAHVYRFNNNTATFIVDCMPDTWDRAGFADMSKEETVATCQDIFARHLGGRDLMSNAHRLRGSAVWLQFPRALCESRYNGNVVLMGMRRRRGITPSALARALLLTVPLRWPITCTPADAGSRRPTPPGRGAAPASRRTQQS